MATTIKVDVHADGPKYHILNITASGDEDLNTESIVDISTMTSPDGVTGNAYPVLVEAQWSINPIFDRATLYYHDEANDEVILRMSGDGSYNSSGYGGGTVDVEASAITEDDYDVGLDLQESGDEDANGSADITLVFKKRLTNL